MSTLPSTRSAVTEPTPASTRRAWIIAIVFLAAGSLVTLTIARRQPTCFAGRIEARSTCVRAPHPGILSEVFVKEGDRISLDDSLASLTDPDLESRITAATSDLSVRTSERAQAEAAAEIEITWRIKELDDAIVSTELKSADYLKEKFDWELERSMWADVISSSETAMFNTASPAFESIILKSRLPGEQRMNAMLKHETADNAVAVSGVQVEICQEALTRLQRTKERLPEQIRQKTGVAVAGERLVQAQAELDRLQARRAELVVKSSAIGTIGLMRAEPGDLLQRGEPIVEILDDARRWVVASVPSSSVPAFAPDRLVKLTFPGGLIRAGHVVAVAPQADGIATDADRDPPVSIRIEETGAAWPNVPLGSRIDVQLAE